MGKEAELLEAARAGNLPAVDRLLASRAKLSGPLASLRRGPGANVQDSSGYTPLHHASLNGHYDIVQLLLKYDASPKILDTKGSSPLHLAAWAGHTGIVRLLLSANPAFTNINHTTRDNESALHCAAQYGHTAVVSMLLQHGADPTIRNSRDETALDLASQYGRLETVELLVRTHPELLDPYRNSQGILPHTPLHRASKNGHKAVVVVLLKAGHNVNACTGAGAALHEAALCGKVNVVRALLTRGADPRVRDRAGHTVLDALAEFPTHVTHEIVALINQYRLSNGFDSETEDLPRIPVHQPDGLNSPYDNVQSNSGNNRHIWERRDGEDERRVSGTSAISIDYTPNPPPIVHTLKEKKPSPSSYMLVLASKCFGIRTKSLMEDDTSNPRQSNTNRRSTVTGAFHIGNSIFFRRRSGKRKSVQSNPNPRKSRSKKGSIVHATSLPDILENPSEASSSLKSILSVTNSIYGVAGEASEVRNAHSSEELDKDAVDRQEDSSKIAIIPPKRRNKSKQISDSDLSRSTTKSETDIPFRETNLTKNSERKTNITKSQSCTEYQIAKPALRLSHSIRTLRNWTADNDSFKSSDVEYESKSFTVPATGNLSYAHLDFNAPQTSKQPDVNSDYELFDFKTSTVIVVDPKVETAQEKESFDNEEEAENPNIFKPIQIYRGSSTVFLDAEEIAEGDINQATNLCINEHPVESDSDSDFEDALRDESASESKPPLPVPRKNITINEPWRNSGIESTRTSYSTFVEEIDFEDREFNYYSNQLTSASSTFEKGDQTKYKHEALAAQVSSNSVIVESMRSSTDFDPNSSTTNSLYETSSVDSNESAYMPMDAVMCFSRDNIPATSTDGTTQNSYIAISTLRQIRDTEDPAYQNVVFAKEVKEREIMSPVSHMIPNVTKSSERDPGITSPVVHSISKERDAENMAPVSKTAAGNTKSYHLRGSENCEYDGPPECVYIYSFNKDSLHDTSVNPFVKTAREPTDVDSDPRNICFCSKGNEYAYIAVEKVDENPTIIPEIDDKEMNLSKYNAFTCYCEDTTCRSHHTRENAILSVTYKPLTHSVSFPNINIVGTDQAGLSIFNGDKKDKSQSEDYSINNRLSSSAFDLCDRDVLENKHMFSSLSFLSVIENPLFANPNNDDEPKRLSDTSLNLSECSDLSYASINSFEYNPVARKVDGKKDVLDVDVASLCRPELEGGRLLCVRSGSDGCHYPYSKSSIMDGSYHSEELSSSYQSGKVREPDQLSISSTTSSTGGPSPRERQRCGTNESSISGQGMYISMGTSGYHAHSPGSNTKVSPTPPKKPPRRNLSVSPTHLLPPGGVPDVGAPNERSHHLVRTGQTRSQDDLDDLGPGAKHSGLRHGRSVDQYVDSKASPRTKPIPQPRPSLALLASRRDQPVAINAMYENIVIKEQNPRRKLRRNNPGQYENINPKEKNSAREEETHSRSKNQKYHSSQERSSLESLLDDVSSYQGGTPSDGESMGYRNDRSSQHTPLSPTHYNQPPTPDHPPPSARQAEMSIHERIRPLSQEYKRMSRDMETETDPRLLARSSSPASSASTDHCVEEYVAEVPFAGLFKGSTTTLDGIGVRPVPAERPKSLRKLKTVYDNGGQGVIGPGGGVIRPKEIQPGTRIDPDVDPWQYRHTEDKEQTSNPSSIASLDKPLSMLSPFDEQEEWAKINEIMASFGSRIVRESVFAEELEQEFQSRLGVRTTYSESSISPSAPAGPSILSWLTNLNLQHLESNFVNNGYDHIDFINGVIEDNDLAEMAIEEPEKTKVLESCKSLPTKIDEVMSAAVGNNHNNNNNNNNNISNNNNSDKESEADPEAVNKWLTSIGLECYQDTFRRHLYTDMERVRRIWEVELTAVLEIQKVGHRRRILASVAGRQNGPINNIDDIADLNTLDRDIQTLKAEIKEKLPETNLNNHVAHPEQQAIIPHAKSAPPPLAVPASQNLAAPTSGGETLKRSHKKNRPPPPPPARGADLEIRAPFALMVGVPGTMCTQWKHQPVVLVTGSVMYVANYLGSTIVKELRGKESTQKSIQKLKKSTNEPRILPDIILSISYRGVKFLNTITRELVCEHEIRNIHLACQDADDLTHFAYITKDITTKSHYCHVFSVATMDQATEVILTLGQAFEVAYQMALRDSATKSNTNTLQAPSGQVRSQSSNQISQQAKTPTHEKSNNNTKDRPNPVHGRSHSVTEIKLNGHQLKVAPITVSISNEDFQAASRNGDVQKSPRTPSAKAPIAVAEEL